ncbi:MAG: S4 domain-containing protein, partial [bacterium]|nr:S4 domain-containing protein [bacterium]
DGRKMSTSWGNVINVADPPNEQFGKVMSMQDDLVLGYFELCTRIPLNQAGALPPRDAKAALAREIVRIYHGEKAASDAEKEFNRVFKEKKIPSEVPEVKITEKSIHILDLLVKIKLASSKSEAQRVVGQGGVKVGGKTSKDWKEDIEIKKGLIIQVGPRKFTKII